MKYLHLVFLMLLASSLIGAHSCNKEERPFGQRVLNEASEDTVECKVDQDCIVIKSDCCGCRQGGKQRALSKSMEKEEIERLALSCGEVMCMQMISSDPSCNKKPVCQSGRCLLL